MKTVQEPAYDGDSGTNSLSHGVRGLDCAADRHALAGYSTLILYASYLHYMQVASEAGMEYDVIPANCSIRLLTWSNTNSRVRNSKLPYGI